MAIQNEELVNKAVITTDALSAAGKLNPAQSEKFIDYVIQETVLKDAARIIRFRNEQLEIEKIGVGNRVTLPKAEAADPGVRRGITTSKVVLQPREIITPFEIGDNFKEINIEGDAVEDHIIRMMAVRMANDIEELFIGGDILGAAALQSDLLEGGSTTQYVKDSFMALQNGWFRLADDGNQVDMDGAPIGLSTFSKMLRALPTKFRRNKNMLRWYMSPDMAQVYIEKLSSRATALGDQATSGVTHAPFGIKIVELPLLSFTPTIVQHITLNTTVASALRYGPVTSVVVLPTTLANTPTTPYVLTTDYTVDLTLGTITRVALGAITDGQVVKVTYKASPQILLTHVMNFIVGIGRDIRIEKDRDIYKGMNQYAITAKVAVELEEDTAVVKGSNIGQSA